MRLFARLQCRCIPRRHWSVMGGSAGGNGSGAGPRARPVGKANRQGTSYFIQNDAANRAGAPPGREPRHRQTRRADPWIARRGARDAASLQSAGVCSRGGGRGLRARIDSLDPREPVRHDRHSARQTETLCRDSRTCHRSPRTTGSQCRCRSIGRRSQAARDALGSTRPIRAAGSAGRASGCVFRGVRFSLFWNGSSITVRRRTHRTGACR